MAAIGGNPAGKSTRRVYSACPVSFRGRLLAAKGYEGVSLTVTAENHSAIRLYRDLDFRVTKEFTACAHNLPHP